MYSKIILERLKKPSTILSVVSQVISILVLLGVSVDVNAINSIAVLGCSILVTLGILSNPDSEKKGYGDDILKCSAEEIDLLHVKINGQMVCKNCGAIYSA